MSFLKKLIDASDRTVDVISIALVLYVILAFSSIITFLGLATYDVVILKHEFHPDAFGTGLGATITGTGLAAMFTLWKRNG